MTGECDRCGAVAELVPVEFVPEDFAASASATADDLARSLDEETAHLCRVCAAGGPSGVSAPG